MAVNGCVYSCYSLFYSSLFVKDRNNKNVAVTFKIVCKLNYVQVRHNRRTMAQRYIMNVNRVMTPNGADNGEAKRSLATEKIMSYEEKTVGSTPFFKCEACPYMALAEDDIKFHLFTEHPDLAKSNGLADNIQIPCPGCTSVFDAEETLRTHLRNHHKMGIKDVKKMVKSLVQIALKNAKLKKEDSKTDTPPPVSMKIPQVIEIVPDVINANHNSLPKGVAFISVDELNKMSTPNFEKIDPKEIIQEASINIVYTNEVTPQYVNVNKTVTSSTSCNILQVSSVTPDLISSIQPRTAVMDNILSPQQSENIDSISHSPQICKPRRPQGTNSFKYNNSNKDCDSEKNSILCSVDNCHFRMKDTEKIVYHRKCHQNGKLICPECSKICLAIDSLHTHLWKSHAIDMELPTCEICGFKTYKRHRLLNIHMKCHGKVKSFSCSLCTKSFKNLNQLTKHKVAHKKVNIPAQCSICPLQLVNERRLKEHVAAVHEKLRPFKCCHCDHTAARKEEMKVHLRSHTGDKPFSCDQCIYRSADHNAMRRHKKMHGKEVAYSCKICPYSTLQSTCFTSHMISKHPDVNTNDVNRCPYCPFKSVNKDKYIAHLTTHTDKEGIKLLLEMSNSNNKPKWTIPSDSTEKLSNEDVTEEQSKESSPKTVDNIDSTIDVEVYDCDSLSESMPQDYSKTYTTIATSVQQSDYNSQVTVRDLSKDDNNSDCLISESSLECYDSNQPMHEYLNTTVSMEQSLMQSNTVNSLVTNSSIGNNISNNIMSNFPIRLPLAPYISLRNNFTLKPVDKISLPLTTKVTGPIIKPTQILPVPSSSNSPVSMIHEPEGAPRKKPKISVKSNLILKGPDQVNMFHSQQQMAFKRLEDNERFGLRGPVTFNNLITTQFMQLQPEPALSESPNNIMPYSQETMCDTATPPVISGINDNSQIFSFNQQMNVNQMTMLPPPQKIQTNDPSYIKLEATIKQNTQSPSLERMCNANLLNTQAVSREYKASPPLEDIHKNMSEIKNEVKSDAYYNLSNNSTNPSIIDQYLIDNLIGEQYSGHLDLSAAVLPEVSDDQQNDVIEIDDNSDDNKLLPRFDMNFPLESLYLMHNDFHFLENDVPSNSVPNEAGVSELNRMVAEVPILNPKEPLDVVTSEPSNDFPNFIQGKKDPMMNTSVRPTVNKINVKNIELMKN